MSVAALKRPGDPDFAATLREIADKVEAGDVREILVVANDQGENVFIGAGRFDDRWRILGALEYARGQVHES